MLSLENTASRMSHLARQEIYFDRHFGLDETLDGRRARDHRRRAARRARSVLNGSLAATVLGPSIPDLPSEKLDLGLALLTVRSAHHARLTASPTAGADAGRDTNDDSALYQPRDGRASGAISAATRPGSRWSSRPPTRWPRRASCRPKPRASCATKAAFDIARIEAIEQVTQHDVIAFTTAVAEHVGPGGALAALRPHLVRCRRHRAGAADARGLRPDRQGPRRG